MSFVASLSEVTKRYPGGVIALDLGGKRGGSTAAGLIDAAGYLGAIVSVYGVARLAEVHGWSAGFRVLAGAAEIGRAHV